MQRRRNDHLRLSLRHDNFSDDRRTGRDSRFDHDQSQKGPHRIGTKIHPVCNFLAFHPLQQILQHFLFALREVELLADLRQKNQCRGSSFKQNRNAGPIRTSRVRIYLKGSAKVTSPAGLKLRNEKRII